MFFSKLILLLVLVCAGNLFADSGAGSPGGGLANRGWLGLSQETGWNSSTQASRLWCSAIQGNYAYFGTSTSPGQVVKVDLSDPTGNSKQVYTLTNGAESLKCAVIDNNYLYVGGGNGKITRVNLSNFSDMTSLYIAGESFLSAVVNNTSHIAYFGTLSGKIYKIDLSNFSNTPSSLTIDKGRLYCGVIDSAGNYAYFGTWSYPGYIIKIRLSDFTWTNTLTLDQSNGESLLFCASIDIGNHCAYFGTDTFPAMTIKIDLQSFTKTGSFALYDSQTNYFSTFYCSVIDTVNGFLYYGTYSQPYKIVKIRLSDFSYSGSLDVDADSANIAAGVIDSNSHYAYFGTLTDNAKIVKINLQKRSVFVSKSKDTATKSDTVTISKKRPIFYVFVDDPVEGNCENILLDAKYYSSANTSNITYLEPFRSFVWKFYMTNDSGVARIDLDNSFKEVNGDVTYTFTIKMHSDSVEYENMNTVTVIIKNDDNDNQFANDYYLTKNDAVRYHNNKVGNTYIYDAYNYESFTPEAQSNNYLAGKLAIQVEKDRKVKYYPSWTDSNGNTRDYCYIRPWSFRHTNHFVYPYGGAARMYDLIGLKMTSPYMYRYLIPNVEETLPANLPSGFNDFLWILNGKTYRNYFDCSEDPNYSNKIYRDSELDPVRKMMERTARALFPDSAEVTENSYASASSVYPQNFIRYEALYGVQSFSAKKVNGSNITNKCTNSVIPGISLMKFNNRLPFNIFNNEKPSDPTGLEINEVYANNFITSTHHYPVKAHPVDDLVSYDILKVDALPTPISTIYITDPNNDGSEQNVQTDFICRMSIQDNLQLTDKDGQVIANYNNVLKAEYYEDCVFSNTFHHILRETYYFVKDVGLVQIAGKSFRGDELVYPGTAGYPVWGKNDTPGNNLCPAHYINNSDYLSDDFENGDYKVTLSEFYPGNKKLNVQYSTDGNIWTSSITITPPSNMKYRLVDAETKVPVKYTGFLELRQLFPDSPVPTPTPVVYTPFSAINNFKPKNYWMKPYQGEDTLYYPPNFGNGVYHCEYRIWAPDNYMDASEFDINKDENGIQIPWSDDAIITVRSAGSVPANDEPCGAVHLIDLVQGRDVELKDISTLNATHSANSGSCLENLTAVPDVWYAINVQGIGQGVNVYFDDRNQAQNPQGGVALYKKDSNGNLIPIGCDNDKPYGIYYASYYTEEQTTTIYICLASNSTAANQELKISLFNKLY